MKALIVTGIVIAVILLYLALVYPIMLVINWLLASFGLNIIVTYWQLIGIIFVLGIIGSIIRCSSS